jgi:hypothetical protein
MDTETICDESGVTPAPTGGVLSWLDKLHASAGPATDAATDEPNATEPPPRANQSDIPSILGGYEIGPDDLDYSWQCSACGCLSWWENYTGERFCERCRPPHPRSIHWLALSARLRDNRSSSQCRGD